MNSGGYRKGFSARQFGWAEVLVFSLVPALLVALAKGQTRHLESFGPVLANVATMFVEPLVLLVVVVLAARREQLVSVKELFPYQQKSRAIVILIAFVTATIWSVFFRDIFQLQLLNDLSMNLRDATSFWPPDVFERPARAFPVAEGTPASEQVRVYSILMVAYGLASASQTAFFRGYLLPRMAHLGWTGVFINTALFAAYHLSLPWFWPQFFVYTVLWGVTTYALRNMWPAILSHVVFNTYWFAWKILQTTIDM